MVQRPKAPVQAHVTANEAIRALERLLLDGRLTPRNRRELAELGRAAQQQDERDGSTQPAGA
jgi:hypothetical protein